MSGTGIADDQVRYDQLCSHGKRRHLIVCRGEEQFRSFRDSIERDSHLRADFFRQRGGGQIEPWPPDSPLARRTKKVRKHVRRGIPTGATE